MIIEPVNFKGTVCELVASGPGRRLLFELVEKNWQTVRARLRYSNFIAFYWVMQYDEWSISVSEDYISTMRMGFHQEFVIRKG